MMLQDSVHLLSLQRANLRKKIQNDHKKIIEKGSAIKQILFCVCDESMARHLYLGFFYFLSFDEKD